MAAGCSDQQSYTDRLRINCGGDFQRSDLENDLCLVAKPKEEAYKLISRNSQSITTRDSSSSAIKNSSSRSAGMKSSKLFFSFRMFKKPRQKGFIGTLLCCFRPNVAQPSTTPNAEDPQSKTKHLLPQLHSSDANKMCMVIDLDETLVHSSFKPISNADFVVPVEIDGTIHQVYVLKRPHVDEFLQKMGQLYECVLFTASLAKYADPVADLLDKWGVFRSRLFRESCVFYNGSYVKDLSRLGRDLQKVVIVDNSPASYFFHKNNAVPVASWFDDMTDTELRDLIPFFEKLSTVENIYSVLQQTPNDPQQPPSSAAELEAQNNSMKNGSSTSPITQVQQLPTSPVSNIPHSPTQYPYS